MRTRPKALFQQIPLKKYYNFVRVAWTLNCSHNCILACGTSQKPPLHVQKHIHLISLILVYYCILKIWAYGIQRLAFRSEGVVSLGVMAIIINQVMVMDPLHGLELERAKTCMSRGRDRGRLAWGWGFTSATLKSEHFVPANEGLISIICFVSSILCGPRWGIPYRSVHIHWSCWICCIALPRISPYGHIIHQESAYVFEQAHCE